jgi:predicted dehydrogenase
VSPFATTTKTDEPLDVILVGVGPQGRAWVRNLQGSSDVRLVGVVDIDADALSRAVAEEGLGPIPTAASVTELLARVDADAVVNVTSPDAHHAVTTEALFAGLPVLSEKPIAPSVAEGLSLAAASEASGQLMMVSQSRRYYRAITQYREVVAQLGAIGAVTTEFFRSPHFGGFRDEMDHPLLLDMAIHAFDAFRYLTGEEPVSVFCEEFNPPWSWYRGDAMASASFVLPGGARYVYTGSWCSPGGTTSWNGLWTVSGEHGVASWNGDDAPTWQADVEIDPSDPGEIPEVLAGSLAAFVRALRTGETPSGTARENVHTLAMVEAAARSSATGAPVLLADVHRDALAAAIAAEADPGVHEVLRTFA